MICTFLSAFGSTFSRRRVFAGWLLAILFLCCSSAVAQVTLVSTFNPNSGGLNGLGVNSLSSEIYVHASFGATIDRYDFAGNSLGSLTDPGDSGNDSDYFFALQATTINGTSVAAGSLLVVEDEAGVAQLIAADALTGAVLATQDLAFVSGQLVGGTFNSATGTFFSMDWSSDVIDEFDGNGNLLNTFGFGGSFDAFFGDVEYNPLDGRLYLVSSTQDFVRVLDSSGGIVADFDVGSLGITGMSGIGFDTNTGDAWISSTNGTVYQVAGLTTVPEPGSAALLLFAAGWFATVRRGRS